VSHSGITVLPGMEEMPSLKMPVQRLKVAILPVDLPCSGPVTHSGEILTTGKSHGKKPDRFPLNDNMDVEKVSRFEYKCNVHVEIQGFDEGIDYFIFYVFHRYVFTVQDAVFAVTVVRV